MKEDKRAFWAGMFDRHQSALHGFFRRRGAEAFDAQDLVQEIYLRLLRVDGRDGEAIENPEAYLYTVASNLVKEHGMLQKRAARHVDIGSLTTELEAPDAAAEELLDREARRRRLQAVLDSLPPRCRAVMVMQYRDEMSYREMASVLGVSTHMVKKHVVKALALCRRALRAGDGHAR